MVRECLGDMLPPLVRALQEWTVALRSKAARSLSAALQLAGSAAADHLLLLLPALRHGRGECPCPGASKGKFNQLSNRNSRPSPHARCDSSPLHHLTRIEFLHNMGTRGRW